MDKMCFRKGIENMLMESAVVISAQPRATLWATALFCFNASPQAGLAKEVSTLRANQAYNIDKICYAYHATASREVMTFRFW
ncbi:hypothetical protein BpHYR1_003295 [Brachionus plicatilis]|uniref:Uncharacterized protein n=1 Tax=Brachionus plicatilis TaxID=10195 RepID=A0A3M7PKZ2_BRAPC|nr:hypothetical protein BpHYR1_003295 [Brachionus plicatilis]